MLSLGWFFFLGQDFFPLTVNYQEKTFAAGKIPGGFFKREGRPSEKETLTSRLIDRPIRPLFAPGFLNETQVVGTVLSHDDLRFPGEGSRQLLPPRRSHRTGQQSQIGRGPRAVGQQPDLFLSQRGAGGAGR